MQKESNDSIVYVPTMHREFFPEGFSGSVRPLWPGLSSRYWGQRASDAWHKIFLPYTPTEATACLAELAQLDEAGIAALSDTAASFRSAAQKVSQEREDLKRFAETGECREAGKDMVLTEDMRRWAQRFLLLGWLQEERVLDMEQLSARYRAGAEKLAAHLGGCGTETEPSDEDADMLSGLLGMMRDLVPDEPATLLPSWRFILDLFAILLPEGTMVCTADQRMAKAFAEAGICQDPVSPSLLARLPEGWHAPAGYAVTYGEEPMWKLIGKKAPQSDRPWLDRRQLVILCTADDVLERA